MTRTANFSIRSITFIVLTVSLLLLISGLVATPAVAKLSMDNLTPSHCEDTIDLSEQQQIGSMVLAISAAIATPQKSSSFDTIIQFGTDSRYYVMIRGWLVQELSGVTSQLNATKDEVQKQRFAEKVNFLTQAIRRIDLE